MRAMLKDSVRTGVVPTVFLVIALILSCNALPTTVSAAPATIGQQFQSPPARHRLYVWWHWMGLTISRYGIKRDLTAMKAAGVAGATICPIGSQAGVAADISNSGTRKPVKYWSPRFWHMVQYAVHTAKRLGLKLGMENCPGWDASGGPWITPALSMKMVVWNITIVKGPGVVRVKLKQPSTRLGFYRAIEVLALPDKGVVQPAGIKNITHDMKPDGQLVWHAPAGRWRIYRIGYTSTAMTDHPVPDSLVGPHGTVHSLEADKLSAKAAAFHIEHVIHALQKHLGAAVGHTFNHLLFDSYEAGGQNWTKHFRRDFIKMRHYDPLPWLPVLSGAVIGSPELSQRFRYDMARTVSQLFVKNDFDVYRKLIDAADMKMCLEPYTGPFNTVAAAASCDVTMGEFWNASRSGIAGNVAGAARADGRTLVGAETLTGGPASSRMTETPAFLKPALDGGFLSGVNKCYLHDWTLESLNKKYKPGILMGWWGTHFGENQTWFKPGIAFFTYINRCQTLLQQGSQVCDICTLNGDPKALSEDALSLSLFEQATVHNGKITLPDGRAYAVLLLPNSSQMLPAVAQKLRQLVAAGATIDGPRPIESPSLTDYPKCDHQVAEIGRAVWGNCDGVHVTEHRFGKGQVVWNKPLPQVLAALGIQPDFSVITANKGPLVIQSAIYAAPGAGRQVNVTAMLRNRVRQNDGTLAMRVDNQVFGGDPAFGHVKYLTVKYTLGGKPATARIQENSMLAIPSLPLAAIHRHSRAMDIYFVVNRSDRAVHAVASFRISGKIPELWLPESGKRLTDGEFRDTHGRTSVPLNLGPQASVFVVFRQSSAGVDPVVAVRRDNRLTGGAAIAILRGGQMELRTAKPGSYELQFASGRRQVVDISPLSAPEVLAGPWKVSFTPGWGAPGHVLFQNLTSWTASRNSGIKYFSGTGVYTQTVSVPASFIGAGKRVILHLGTLHSLAQVWVNGHKLGVLWHAPFKVDVTSAIRAGRNRIRIAVTNTWANRLIGDLQHYSGLHWGVATSVGRPLVRFPNWVVNGTARPSKDCYTFETWNYYKKSSRLRRSGLLGPVRLTAAASVLVSAARK
ncbi:MAG: glycosyl hydrolase [Phycisphaerae bacterium]